MELEDGEKGCRVQSALFRAQHNHCKHDLTAAWVAFATLGLSTAKNGLRRIHGPYHYLMNYRLWMDSGGETAIVFRCIPTTKSTVLQILDSSKLLIHTDGPSLKSMNHKRMQAPISLGNRLVGRKGN